MKKVNVQQNLGKKSLCRFPRRPLVIVRLKMQVPASLDDMIPTLSQPLAMIGIKADEFCDSFNEQSLIYEDGFPVYCLVAYTVLTKTFEIFLRLPFFWYFFPFLLPHRRNQRFPWGRKVLLTSLFLASLIYQLPEVTYFSSALRSTLKQFCGTLKACEFKLRHRGPRGRTSFLAIQRTRAHLAHTVWRRIPSPREKMKRKRKEQRLLQRRRAFQRQRGSKGRS